MVALSHRPFRNAALALYGAGTLASFGLASLEANAQTLASASQPDMCAPLANDPSPKGIEAYVACEVTEIRRRTEASRQRGIDADRRGTEADRRGSEADRRAAESQRETLRLQVIQGCIDFLKENRGKSFTQERMVQLAGGKVSEDNACIVARTLGYVGRRAALETPTTR